MGSQETLGAGGQSSLLIGKHRYNRSIPGVLLGCLGDDRGFLGAGLTDRAGRLPDKERHNDKRSIPNARRHHGGTRAAPEGLWASPH